MPEPSGQPSGTPPPGAITDQELEEAFGADLGEGPEQGVATAPSAMPQASEATAAAPSSVDGAHVSVDNEGVPSWSEFASGWQIGIYRDPVLCGVLAGAVLGMLGVFVVLRRAVFVTAAVSQAAGLGVAVAFLAGITLHVEVPPVLGALVFALGATIVLTFRMHRMRLPPESLVGLVYLATSAGAVLVGDRIAQESHDIAGILFGTAVLVRPLDLWLVAGAGAFTLLALALSYRGLLFVGFDPEGASVQGLPVRLLELLLWALVALEVSVTTRAIGALPVFAFAVLPAMAALALSERIRSALVIATVLGGLSGGLGYLFAFFFEFPVGASQATLAVAFLLLCLPIARLLRGSAA